MSKFRKVAIPGKIGVYLLGGGKAPGQKVKTLSGIDRVLSAPLRSKKGSRVTLVTHRASATHQGPREVKSGERKLEREPSLLELEL